MKKKKEKKGFDALEASFLEKGLIAAGDSRSMGLKAIEDTHTHQVRHHFVEKKRERRHKVESKTKSAGKHLHAARHKMAAIAKHIPRKIKPKHSHRLRQLKKPDIEDPDKGKKR